MAKLWSSKPSLWVRFPFPLCVLIMWVLCQNFLKLLSNTSYQNKRLLFIICLFFNWASTLLCANNLKYLKLRISRLEIEKNIYTKSVFINFVDVLTYYQQLSILNRFTLSESDIMSAKVQTLNNNRFYVFNNNQMSTVQLYLYGLRSVWKHIRLWVLPLVVSLLFMYYSFFMRSLPFAKVFFGYLLLANMFYLFISGFVFFFKKYQYRLYTSAIQRFWRRTLMVFWIIEGILFSIFVYLIFNANQEPIYMYDNIQIYKTHFYSWRFFLSKIIVSTFVVILTYILLLSIKWNTFSKTNNFVLVITVLILYVAWLEFYQLFHLMTTYGVSNWVYDFSEHLWNLELEFKRTRIVNHYVTIGLVAKFWHIVFAVVFWIFFILRGVESSRYRYPLLVANLQNFVIVYILSWLYMYPWFKSILRKSMDMPYFWFFVNNRKVGVFLFFNDIKLYFYGMSDFLNNCFGINIHFKKTPFYYWYESSINLGSTQFRKHNIRDVFVNSIKC